MTVEAMWRRPVCVGGIVWNAVFISVLPFSEIMLRTYWRVMPWQTFFFFFFLLMTPSDENKKAKSCLYIHLACPGHNRQETWAQKQEKKQTNKKPEMHCKIDGEIALNLFSIFTVYNICHVIYSQLLFIYIYISALFFNSVYF